MLPPVWRLPPLSDALFFWAVAHLLWNCVEFQWSTSLLQTCSPTQSGLWPAIRASLNISDNLWDALVWKFLLISTSCSGLHCTLAWKFENMFGYSWNEARSRKLWLCIEFMGLVRHLKTIPEVLLFRIWDWSPGGPRLQKLLLYRLCDSLWSNSGRNKPKKNCMLYMLKNEISDIR